MALKRSGVRSSSAPLFPFFNASPRNIFHICQGGGIPFGDELVVVSCRLFGSLLDNVSFFAKVAELVYALVSKTSGFTAVWVRFPPLALFLKEFGNRSQPERQRFKRGWPASEEA